MNVKRLIVMTVVGYPAHSSARISISLNRVLFANACVGICPDMNCQSVFRHRDHFRRTPEVSWFKFLIICEVQVPIKVAHFFTSTQHCRTIMGKWCKDFGGGWIYNLRWVKV